MSAAKLIFKPIPSIVPAVKDNLITHEKVTLGKSLFFVRGYRRAGLLAATRAITLGLAG
ncbi:cytochrome c peroxidase [Bradyrhizobium shewense]|uniref:Cytochrome c peroxidase n=1 Tax=Bradyrhizobium shewense TaxID=1761772 RepID=A0A1C3VUM0_9BRAD|nr:cytochrome c peroxidase [Bradyrhizobium shewense]